MIVMKSMEMDDESQIDAPTPYPMAEKARYPYGLRICLTHEEFDKLGLDPSEAVSGGMVHGHFMARITDVSASDTEHSGSTCRVEMQIEDLALESESEEDEQN